MKILKYDYLIVGCGITGVVLAERLSNFGKSVLIIEKRNHIGGNCYDNINECGVLVHRYGPHYFRTDSLRVFKYLSKFTDWHYHNYIVKSKIGNKLYTFPININTLEEFFKVNLSKASAKSFLDLKRDKTIKNPSNIEEYLLSKIGKELYDSFFKGYTEKQWGLSPKNLDVSIIKRIPIRFNRDNRYFNSRIQAMPKLGYTNMFYKMLNNPRIHIKLNTPYNPSFKNIAKKIIWTGCIDEYFNYKFGKLGYRSLFFKFKNFLNKEYVQDCEQINYPDINIPWTRIVEIKHATGQKINNTTISIEFPSAKGEPYYPILNKENLTIYNKYFSELKKEKNIYFIGRLANYAYINMDEAVKLALDLVPNLL